MKSSNEPINGTDSNFFVNRDSRKVINQARIEFQFVSRAV